MEPNTDKIIAMGVAAEVRAIERDAQRERNGEAGVVIDEAAERCGASEAPTSVARWKSIAHQLAHDKLDLQDELGAAGETVARVTEKLRELKSDD